MLITRKKNKSLPPPQIVLDGIELKRVHSYKYLGITITSNISWTTHITDCCNNTRSLIGLMYRRFYQHSSPTTLTRLYCSFIRPHLEYGSIVWNPGLKGKSMPWRMCKFALQMCTKQWDSTYDQLLANTNLPSLKDRRTQASLCHLFKVIHGDMEFPDAPVYQWIFNYKTPSITM